MEERIRVCSVQYQAERAWQVGEKQARRSKGRLTFLDVALACPFGRSLNEGDTLAHSLQELSLSMSAVPGGLRGMLRLGTAEALAQVRQFGVGVLVCVL